MHIKYQTIIKALNTKFIILDYHIFLITLVLVRFPTFHHNLSFPFQKYHWEEYRTGKLQEYSPLCVQNHLKSSIMSQHSNLMMVA